MNAMERTTTRDRLYEALHFWHGRWTLDGLYVACPYCHAQQIAEAALEPFQHLTGCTLASEFTKHPWIELRNLLADLPPERA